jgi:hypothetical protein
MYLFHRTLPVYLIIAWFTTGLMLIGPAVSFLGADERSAICVDERVLESDEERIDFGGLELGLISILHPRLDKTIVSPLIVYEGVDICTNVCLVHFQRGPPCS